MDEQYLLATARYIEMNPVAAKLVQNPEDYQWSSAQAHLAGENDALAQVSPLLKLVSDWRNFLNLLPTDDIDLIHRHERTGRPLGKEGFIEKPEIALHRGLRPQKPGRKKIKA